MSWAGHRVGFATPWHCTATTPRLHVWWGHSHDRQDRQHKTVALCRVRRGQETLGIYLLYSASLSARTQRKSTMTTSEGLVLVSTPWHAHPVCLSACVGAPPGALLSSSKTQHACSMAPGPAWLKRHQGAFIHQEYLLQTQTLITGFSHVLLLHCCCLHGFLALFPLKLSCKGAIISIDSLLL